MPWQPPIPSGALYSPQAIALGPGLALLAWCYDQVERDGTVQISLEKAAADIGKPYGTIRDWWRAMRGETASPFFAQIVPRGRKGWQATFRARWIDWRILTHNYPERRDFSADEPVSADMSAASAERGNGAALSAEISTLTTEGAEKCAVSSQFERRDLNAEPSAYMVLHDDHDPPPPPQRESQPPRAQGGGGGATREGTDLDTADPLYALFVSPRYGILNADRLMPQWAGQDVERVRKLLERLYRQAHDPTKPQHTGGRLYRALQAGPAALFAPVAQSPPPAPSAQSPPVAVLDVRTAAARLTEKRYGHTKPHDPD